MHACRAVLRVFGALPGLSRPILKNLGFLGFLKKPKKPES